MSENIASIYIDAKLDTRGLQKQLLELESKKLSISVNDKALTDLNKHFDLKRRDYNALQKHFDSKPLIVRVEDSELTRLNRTFASFSQQSLKFPVEIDDRRIVDSINEIKKLFQAQVFQTKVEVDKSTLVKDISEAIQGVSANPNLSVNLKLKEGTNSRGSFSEISTQIKNVEKAVRRNKPQQAGVLKTVATGGLELIGGQISRSLIMGLKRDLGLDINKIARPITRTIAKPLKKITPESYAKFEDDLVDSLEQVFVFNNPSAFKEKLVSTFKPLGDELKETFLETLSQPLYAAAQPLRIRKRVMLAKSAMEAEKEAEKIKIPESEKSKIEASKSISIITGGINFEKGGVNTDFAENLVKRVTPDAYSVPVRNPWSNDKDTLGMLYKITGQDGTRDPMPIDKLLQVAIEKGFNPDSIAMASQAMAYRKQFPDKPINLLGTSGGSYVVEEALSILQRHGMQNVKGAGITAPFAGLTATAKPGSFTANVGDLDPLFMAMFGGKGVADKESLAYKRTLAEIPLFLPGLLNPNKSSFNRVVPGAGVGHALLPFLAESEFQSNLKGHLGDSIGAMSPDFAGQKGIRNLDTLRLMNDERQTIPRTLKAVFGDSKTLRQIEKNDFGGSEGYTFAVPQKPDWRRDNDFQAMMGGALKKKGRKATGEVEKEYKEYTTFLEELNQGLVEFLDSGAIVKTKLSATLQKAIKFYPELEDIQKRLLNSSLEMERISKLNQLPANKDTRDSRTKSKDSRRLQRLQNQFPEGIKQPNIPVAALSTIEEESKALLKTSEDFKEVSQELIDSEMLRTRTLVSNYKQTYDKFKAAVKSAKKTGNNSEVKKLGDEILKDAALLEAAIKKSKDTLKLSGTIGRTPENNALNQQLSVISRYKNTVTKEFNLKGLDLPETNEQATKVGQNIPDAMAQGLTDNSSEPELVMEEIAEKVIKKAEKTFEIESPSKVFKRIGGFINQGLKQGINQNTSGSDSLFANLLTKALEFRKNIENAFGKGSAVIQLGLFATTLSKIIPLLAGVASESLEVSNQIQVLEKRITFISGSKSAGQEQIQQLNNQASKLGLNPVNNLDGVTNLLSASRGTPLALAETTKGQLAVNQAARVYNLTLEEQGRANVALQQILGKGVVQQEELRGQLSEAIPGAAQIAARAFGVTTQELNKMVSSGLDATEFFRKFTDQLDIETAGGVVSALGTNQGRQGLADTKIANLKKSFGDLLLPLQSASLDGFNRALDLINATLPITITLTGVLITKMSILASSVLIDLVKQLFTIQVSFAALKSSLIAVRGFLVSAFKEFAVVAFIGIGINNLANQFRDLSGELRGQVNAVKTLQDEYAKLLNTTDELSKNKSNFEVFKNRAITSIKSLVTGEVKAVQDSTKAIVESMTQTESIFKIASGSDVKNSLSQLSQIDKALEEVQIKKRALAINNPGDKEGLRLLDNRQTELLNQRSESTKIPTNIRKQIASQIEATKAQIEYLQKLKATYPLYGDEVKRVDARIQTLTENSEKLNNAQDDINKKLGESATAFSLLQKSLKTVSDTYADLNNKNTLFNNLQKVQSSVSAIRGNISSEQENYQNQRLERQANVSRLRQLQQQYSQSRALISTPENQQIMSAYQVDFSTGINRLNSLAEQVTNIKDKFVFETLAQLKQQQLDISDLSVEIINARREAQKQLIDLTKQVSDYYLNISRQSQETALEIKKINLETSNISLKNQLRESLTNGYETIIGSLVDGIESALDSFTSAADRAIESQQSLLTTQFGIEDSNKAGRELSRSIPKVEVALDFSSIPSDNNVVKLREELDDSVGGAENLGEQIQFTTASTEELYAALTKAIEPILAQSEKAELVQQGINAANIATNQAHNSTLNWNSALTPVNSNIQNVNNGFVVINETLGNLITRTGEWLGQLVNAPNLLGNIGNTVTSFFGGNSTGDAATSAGFISPIKGKTLDELIKYKPTRGQGFFGMRDGGRRQHSKVDFDSRVGAGQGAEIIAAISGTATARAITPMSAGVNIEGKDSKGNNITVVYNHLALPEINKLFNHENGGKGLKPLQVKAGQRLSTVTMDGLSTGPHLDFGIKVNGKYVEPQKWLATEGKAMAQMQRQMQAAKSNNPNNSGGILWGKAANYAPSDLSGLTERGKKALEALKNPNVRAALDAIAVAELGESAANKGGYGYLFGDTGGKETFNPNTLKSHPKRRVPFGNTASSATGRYQTMDFVWNEEAGRLGIKDFKPQSQEIMAVSRLMYRRVLDDVKKGNIASAISKPGDFDLSSEWASLEGNPYGQGTKGGKRSTFLNNFSSFANQPTVNAARANRAVSTPRLQASVQASTNQANTAIQDKNTAQQANIQAQIRRDRIAGETALSKVKRTTERTVRDSQDAITSRAEKLTDLRYDAKVSLTPREEGLKSSTEIFRQKSQTLRTFRRDLEDAKRTVAEADKLIQNAEASLVNETDADRKRVLSVGVAEAKKTREIKLKEVNDLNNKIAEISEAFDKKELSRAIKFSREAEDKLQAENRKKTDLAFSSIPFPTKQQQNLKDSTLIKREQQDALKPLERALEDAKRELLDITDSSERKIKLKEIEEAETKIRDLTKAYQGQETARYTRATFEEYVRSSKAAINLQTEENDYLQEKIAQLEKIKELYPTDDRLLALPGLKEELSINQLNVEAARELLDIEEQIKRSGDDPIIVQELSKQLELLEKTNDSKIENIRLTRQQQEEEIRLANQLRTLTIRTKFSELDSQLTESAVNRISKANSKNAFGRDTGEFEKARYESFNAQITAADIELQKNIRDIEEFSKANGLLSEQVASLVNKVEDLNRVKLDGIKAEFEELLATDKIAELQKIRQNLETQFSLIQQPKYDLINAQLDQYTNKGGNVFVANAERRRIGEEQELFQRDQALRNLDEQVSSARLNGIDITDSQVATMRDNLVEMSQLRLDNLTVQFKDISTTLGDITKQGLQSFGNELATLITRGGDLGSIFDNLFDNIFNSVLNLGISSLLGGLFGGVGLFNKGQIPNFAGGGIHYQSLNKAMAAERSLSGRKPQLAVVHENELIIPAHRTEELAKMGLAPEMLLGKINNYASGKLPSRSQLIDRTSENDSTIKVKTEVINKKEYVSVDELQLAMREAAKQGAEQGSRKVQMQLQNSTSYRTSVGL